MGCNPNLINLIYMSKLSEIVEVKNDIKNSISEKGVEVDVGMSLYYEKINLIPYKTGGKLKGVRFGGSTFTSAPNIDISDETNIDHMFWNCKNLTSIPQFSTTDITSMFATFQYCESIVDTSNLMYWDTSKVSDMTNMFDGCSSISSIPLLDVSSLRKADHLFYNCSNLVEIKLKGDPSNIWTGSVIFEGVGEGGTLYYDDRYDYRWIISELPSSWDAVPFNFIEEVVL